MSKEKLSKKSLYDEFEVRGQWWIPGSETNVYGTLIGKKDGTTLEIFGRLGAQDHVVRRINTREEVLSSEEESLPEAELETEVTTIENNDTGIQEVIWGFTEKGEEITIFSYGLSSTKMNIPGFQVESYFISEFLVGRHVHDVNDLEIESIKFEFTYMSKWLGMNTLLTSPVLGEGEIIGQQLQTVNPDNMNAVLSSIDAVLENTGVFNWKSDRYEKAVVSFTSLFKLTANSRKDADWYLDKMFSMQKLLTLLTGHSIYTKRVSFKGVTETENIIGRERQRQRTYNWFYDQIDDVEIKEKIDSYDFTIQYPEIRELFPCIVDNWFEKENNLDVVYDLYTSEFYKTIHLTSTFLNYMQAIEVYHRRIYGGKIINDEEYEIFQNTMREFIEREAPKDLKPKLLGSLPYGNERSLNYRLKDLARGLLPETKMLLFNSNNTVPSHFFQRIIDTRNYLTHYDASNKNIIEVEDRYYAIQILKAFVTVLLFKELGMHEEFILSKLLEVRHLENNLNFANQILEN